MVSGKLQQEGEVTHVVVQECYNMSWPFYNLKNNSSPIQTGADEPITYLIPPTIKPNRSGKIIQGNLFFFRDFK